MTELATDPLTLGHVAITLIAIISGLIVLTAMIRGQNPKGLTAIFLLFTVLTSATGFLFPNHTGKLTPAQTVGIISLVILAVALFALYVRHLAGVWRGAYVVTASLALYLNCFVLVIQTLLKLPKPAITGGPVFGGAQGVVLLGFLIAGWLAFKNFRPSNV
jgi:hypothetical protein